jgi:hypothetical protein
MFNVIRDSANSMRDAPYSGYTEREKEGESKLLPVKGRNRLDGSNNKLRLYSANVTNT